MNRRSAIKTAAIGASSAFVPMAYSNEETLNKNNVKRQYSTFGVFLVLS